MFFSPDRIAHMGKNTIRNIVNVCEHGGVRRPALSSLFTLDIFPTEKKMCIAYS